MKKTDKKDHKGIIQDQEYFFDKNAEHERIADQKSVFYSYVNKEQFEGFKWLEDRKIILEYGCSTGNSLEVFFRTRDQKNYFIYGVDIAGMAIKKMQKKYPKYKFYKISNNKIPQIKKNTVDATFITHVLHHAHDHSDIFREIHSKLKKNGKFLINDLTSNNIFNNSARSLFTHMPKFVKDKFNDDLVVDEHIPEKIKVDVDFVIKELEDIGFKIDEIGYGHLFVFTLGWFDRFVPLSKISLVKSFYKKLMNMEKYLLQYKFFQKQAEVVYIKSYKR